MVYEIRQELCSCCHRCRVLCPRDAIVFKNAKYWINPEKCIGCGLCAKNCHNCAIFSPEEKPPVAVPHEPRVLDCDVAVCGAGGSGLMAAVRLAQNGKKVIVLEKSRNVGGNTWYASGFHGHYSRLQQEAGEPDRREQIYEQLMKDTDNLLDPQLARNTIYATADMTDWLIEHCDCEQDFVLGPTPSGSMRLMYQNKTGTKYKRIDASIGPGGMGSFVIEKLMGQCKKLGLPVLTATEAKELIVGEDGAVIGVKAEDAGGQITVNAPAVIMATGSYSHNPEYLAKANPEIPNCPEPLHYFSVPTCTGDGITMCQKVGADIDWKNAKAMILGPAHHPYSFAAVCLTRENEVVLINRDGKRWASEVDNTMGLRFKVLEQPGRMSWAIFDQGVMDKVAQRLTSGKGPHSDPEHAEIISHYQEEIDQEATMDIPVKKADTLEELAVLMGVPVDTFVSEMNHYNEMCHQGKDTQFGKPAQFLLPMEQGPYYAFYEKLFQENAAGGMKIDPQTRVKNVNGDVIPGLYAVGDNSAGLLLGTGDYSDFLERTVSMFTWAMTSGYMVCDAVLEDLK
ncbi:MAG: FAD-dependent oxidoreductase [Oscillospiraceae bacterium]|nr:FAD-dependent oxidoreductase [Oscillospiraceae bacterium]